MPTRTGGTSKHVACIEAEAGEEPRVLLDVRTLTEQARENQQDEEVSSGASGARAGVYQEHDRARARLDSEVREGSWYRDLRCYTGTEG